MFGYDSETNGISIQVSLGGYSFRVGDGKEIRRSGWLDHEKLFTAPEFHRSYDRVEISLLTPKAALIPEEFFSASTAREALADVVPLRDDDRVGYMRVPDYGAVLLFSTSIDETFSKVVARTVMKSDGSAVPIVPETYYLLRDVAGIGEYNKIMASYADGWLYLAIAQGDRLSLCNVFPAVDFTTAEYFIFLVMKSLQMNPEVSSVFFRTPLSMEEELSLYRYFKAVERV